MQTSFEQQGDGFTFEDFKKLHRADENELVNRSFEYQEDFDAAQSPRLLLDTELVSEFDDENTIGATDNSAAEISSIGDTESKMGLNLADILDVTTTVACTESKNATGRGDSSYYADDFLTDRNEGGEVQRPVSRGARGISCLEVVTATVGPVDTNCDYTPFSTARYEQSMPSTPSNVFSIKSDCSASPPVAVCVGQSQTCNVLTSTSMTQTESIHSVEKSEDRYNRLYKKFIHNLNCIRSFQARDLCHKQQIEDLQSTIQNLESKLAQTTTDLLSQHLLNKIVTENQIKFK